MMSLCWTREYRLTRLNSLKSSGATVLNRPFDNYAAQRNFGLSHDFKHDWVLMLDADERIPSDFVDELRSVTEQGLIQLRCIGCGARICSWDAG